MKWLDAISDAIAVADELKNVDLKSKLADVKLACVDLAEENVRLREERNALRDRLRQRDEMVWDGKRGAYQKQNTSGDLEGTYCPNCYHAKDKVVPMAPEDQDFRCPVCKHLVDLTPPSPSVDFGFEGKSIMDEVY